MIPVFVLNWNGWSDTEHCIYSLLDLKDIDFQIHLIDNASQISDRERITKTFGKHSKIKIHLLSENFGFAKAHNLIVKKVLDEDPDIEFIALINNDTLVDPHWLKSLHDRAVTNNCGAVSSKMIQFYNHGRMDNFGHFMLNTGEILPLGHNQSPSNFDKPVLNFGPCAGGAIYAVPMIQDIGFFDPFFDTGYEDAELGYRAKMAGYTLMAEPNAIVFHKKGKSVSKIFDQEYAIRIQENIFYTYFKLTPPILLLINTPLMVIKYLMVCMVNLIFARQNVRIFTTAFKNTFAKNWQSITTSRRAFFKNRRRINSFKLAFDWTFFILFDIQRFYRLFVKNNISNLEIYTERPSETASLNMSNKNND